MLELFFPPLCFACGSRTHSQQQLCHECLGKLRYLTPPWCSLCGIPQSFQGLCLNCMNTKSVPLNQIRSVFIYEEPLRKLIHQWKFKDHPELSAFFGRQLILFTQLYLPEKPWDIIIPVPLHRIREREREYNQSYLLAQMLSQSLGIPLSSACLKRVRHTPFQSSLTQTARRENLGSAFWADGEAMGGLRILLIDDLYTTGETLHQSASSLREKGALQVTGLTLARTLLT